MKTRPTPPSPVTRQYPCLGCAFTVAVARSLRDDGPALVVDLVERTGRGANSLGLDLRLLRGAGLAESRPYPRAGKSLLWSLTELGRRVLAELDRA